MTMTSTSSRAKSRDPGGFTHRFRYGIFRLRFVSLKMTVRYRTAMTPQEIFDSLGQAFGEKLQAQN